MGEAGQSGSTTFKIDESEPQIMGNPALKNPDTVTSLFSTSLSNSVTHTLHITNNGVDLFVSFFSIGALAASTSTIPPHNTHSTESQKIIRTTCRLFELLFEHVALRLATSTYNTRRWLLS